MRHAFSTTVAAARVGLRAQRKLPAAVRQGSWAAIAILGLVARSAHGQELLPVPASPLDDRVAYMCPIHSDYTSEVEGRCPRDGMALVRATPFDVRDYAMQFSTQPRVARAGERTTLRFAIHHPGSGELVRDFAMVHDRRYHLFVINQDMEYFEHIHPEQDPDGSWTIDVTLPRAGYYKVLSDFVPSGGTAQFIARPLVTRGYDGDLVGERARLVADTASSKTVGDLTAALTLDPPTFVAGLYGHLNFHLTDSASGEPATDLQAYLGAFGHTLILNEDMSEYVHSHPIDLSAGFDDEAGPMLFMIPMGVDAETLRGGPDVTFDALMPRAGRYRAFTQFRRHDEVRTFAFTFEVAAAE